MSNTLRFQTNLNCNACVAAVRPHLEEEPSISHWEVDVAVPEKILTVQGDAVSTDQITSILAKAGFQVLKELPASPAASAPVQISPGTYFPLALLGAFLVGVVALVELAAGGFVWERAMRHFMGGFFLVFSFFKLLDLRGFADSYRMYDILARRVPAYAFIYPFIELGLGAAYVTGFQPVTTSLLSLVVMSVSAVGVIQSLLAKRSIRCACLGTVFNLPMSTVTLIEDGLMILMAAVMLFPTAHGASAVSNNSISNSQKGTSLMQHSTTHTDHVHRENLAPASLLVHENSIRKAGQPSTLRLMIHAADGAMIKHFDVVHEAQVHLIIVREGLDTFGHVHPQPDAAGNLVVSYTFPAGGTYRLYADYQPSGGSPATATGVVQVPGADPSAPVLTPNVPGRVLEDGLIADVAVEFIGESREAVVRFELSDLADQPLRDLRPYLGAMGHLVLVSRDGQDYVHAHPLERDAHDTSSTVEFHAQFSHNGLYKGWGQLQRGDGLHVVPFVLEVH